MHIRVQAECNTSCSNTKRTLNQFANCCLCFVVIQPTSECTFKDITVSKMFDLKDHNIFITFLSNNKEFSENAENNFNLKTKFNFFSELQIKFLTAVALALTFALTCTCPTHVENVNIDVGGNIHFFNFLFS